ncbi:DUF4229 domain-containing protein [Micrococcus cohnii]|uniref:Mannitol-specific phosphotransferase system IIBC component n=1 Tax=Micrococcus cohnii TaxID=993416 RepID=A0A7W7GPC8_9MICC|nr:DUF4229 domain-containing protein [uncultured Micrococcus sp.]MBB4735807.1 mannitol-specific phosphotransferase system IIBC component [Micrococcus cohnii]
MRILLYGLVRLAIFAAVWGLCLWLGTGFLVAVIVATVLTFAISYLFLDRLRRSATSQLNEAWAGRPGRRGRTEQADADAEDAYTQGRYRE